MQLFCILYCKPNPFLSRVKISNLLTTAFSEVLTCFCFISYVYKLSLLPYPRYRLVLPRELLHSRVGESARGAAFLVHVVAVPAAAPASHVRGLVVLAETRAAFCHKVTRLLPKISFSCINYLS